MKTNRQKIWRAAVVGGGAFGEAHLRTYASMPQVEVAGVYTVDRDRGASLSQQYGGLNYESLAALADDPAVDVVSIVTPEDCHLETFQVLAASGKAIYVEKPLATDLAEARTILELSRKTTAMSGHCLRFEHRLAHVFEKLKGVPKHHLSFRDRRTRQEKDTYGRVHPAFAMLCHEVELSNAFAESTFSRVMALETRVSEGQVDGMTILIEYANGVTSVVEGGWYLPRQTQCIENDFASILSAQGLDEITIPHLGYYHLSETGLEVPNLAYGHGIYGREYGPLRAAFDYFIDCLAKGSAPEISTVDDAFHAVELIDAAIRSAAENRWVLRGGD